MTPYEPASVYLDSFPVLELTVWPVGDTSFNSLTYDVVDFLPAVHPINNLSPSAAHFEALATDFRFVVSWHFQMLGTWTLDNSAGHTRVTFIVEEASSILLAPTPTHVFPISQARPIQIMNTGLVSPDANGRCHVNGRFLRARLDVAGNVPGALRFGAYLRVL